MTWIDWVVVLLVWTMGGLAVASPIGRLLSFNSPRSDENSEHE